MSTYRPFVLPMLLAVLAVQARGQEPGDRTEDPAKLEHVTMGFQPPEVADVVLHDALAAEDKSGGNNQQLVALTGTSGGWFAAVWRDHRDAMTGLYLGRFDPEGRLLEPEQPVHAPGTQRRNNPAVALREDGSGAVAWTMVVGGVQETLVRAFDRQGRFLEVERLVARPSGFEKEPAKALSLCCTRDGGFALAWSLGRNLALHEWNLSGKPEPVSSILNASSLGADPLAFVVANKKGDVVALWTGEKGLQFSSRSRNGLNHIASSPGLAQALAVDWNGGFWALSSTAERTELLHLGGDGRPDRPPVTVAQGAIGSASLGAHAAGVGVIMEPAGAPARGGAEKPARGERGRATESPQISAIVRGAVHLFDAQGAPVEGGIVMVPSDAAREVSGLRIVSNGRKLVVAWTDTRNGDNDVWARFVDTAAGSASRLSAEFRLNSDVASADQLNSRVTSNGTRGLVTWQDRRELPVRAYVRRFDDKGFVGGEIALPLAREGETITREAMERPACALLATGDALISWRAQLGKSSALRAQILDSGSKPRTGEFEIDGFENVGTPTVIAIDPVGFGVVWIRGGAGGVWFTLVKADGTQAGPAVLVSQEGSTEFPGNLSLASLQDGAIVVAWDAHKGDEKTALRARFLDANGAPRKEVIAIEASSRGVDWDPSIAPSAKGGFALSWTSGGSADPSRDVVARLFDARGKPVSSVIHVSFGGAEQDFSEIVRLADGSFAVAWEDDISFYDHAYVRRIDAAGKWLGPMMRLNELETKFMPDRVSPSIAPLGNGLVATWGDRRRSLGFDVFLKICGPRFDPRKVR